MLEGIIFWMLLPTWFSALEVGDSVERPVVRHMVNRMMGTLDTFRDRGRSEPPSFTLVKLSKGFLTSQPLSSISDDCVIRTAGSFDDIVPVCEFYSQPTDNTQWFWTCKCLQELLENIIPLPKELITLIINDLHLTRIPWYCVFADSASSVWMQHTQLYSDKIDFLGELTWALPRPHFVPPRPIPWRKHLVIVGEKRTDLLQVGLVMAS